MLFVVFFSIFPWMSSSCLLAGVLTVSVVCEHYAPLCCSSRAVGNKFIYKWGIGKNPEFIPYLTGYHTFIVFLIEMTSLRFPSSMHPVKGVFDVYNYYCLSMLSFYLSDNLLAIIPKPDPIIPSVESFSRIISYQLCCQRLLQVEKNDWVASLFFSSQRLWW